MPFPVNPAPAVVALLRAVRFNVLAERSGLAGSIPQSNMNGEAAGAIGLIAKWFVRLIALVVAFDALGLLGRLGNPSPVPDVAA